MDAVHRRIGVPVLTELRLEPAGLGVVPGTLVPSRLPDLFAGAPLLILGRYRGMAEGGLALHGRQASGEMWLEHVESRSDASAALPAIWARGRLRELEDRYVTGHGDRKTLEKEIVDTSLRFGVLCRFTAYVAVDRSEVVNPGGQVHGMMQPVEPPAGWDMLTQTAAGALGAVYRMAPAPMRSARSRSYGGSGAMPSAPHQEVNSLKCPPPAASAAEPVRAMSRRSGIIEGLLNLFGGGKKARKGKASVDRGPHRQRVIDLLQEMQAGAGDGAARLAVLRAIIDRAEEVFKDLVAAGDRHDSVRELGQTVLVIRAMLAGGSPPDAIVLGAWQRLETALRDWLALVPQPPADPTPSSKPRKGFWK
jgi:Ca-activated chloride channel family protein